MEYFDLYNELGIKLNKIMARGSSNESGEYHKVVHIWIKNSKGEYLVQQRNKSTDINPYQWAPTAGAVSAGEDFFTAAIRETKEEIGLSLSKNQLFHKGTIFREDTNSNYIIELFIVYQDVDLKDLIIDTEEVRDVAYINKEELFKMIDANRFWDFRDISNYFSILEKRV